MIARLVKQVWQQARSWWRHDRIRVSPREGRLLRLQPGDLLQIDGLQVEVLSRSVEPTLRLVCQIDFGRAELTITQSPTGHPEIISWTTDTECRRLSEDEIEVWPRSRRV